jgi:hypothetical protein
MQSADKLEAFSGGLAVATSREFALDALTLSQVRDPRPLYGRDVHKGIGSTSLRLDESIALGVVEPLYDSGIQGISLS